VIPLILVEQSEKNEEQGDGGMDPLFGQSDLVMTIPDEEYDKLEKEGKISDEGNTMVKREHPKESENVDTEKTSESNESKDEQANMKSCGGQSEGNESGQESNSNSSESESTDTKGAKEAPKSEEKGNSKGAENVTGDKEAVKKGIFPSS
jgi:hypothetical protein